MSSDNVNFITTLTRAQEMDYHRKGSDKRVLLAYKQLTTPGYDMLTVPKESLEAISKAILEGKSVRVLVSKISTISPNVQNLEKKLTLLPQEGG